jgi:hypothetical protein
VALGTALTERSVPLRPKLWLAMLRTFIALPAVQRVLKQKPSHVDPHSGLTLSATHDEMIFIVRATALSGIDELCELVDGLDAEHATDRERYLAAASNLLQSTTLTCARLVSRGKPPQTSCIASAKRRRAGKMPIWQSSSRAPKP